MGLKELQRFWFSKRNGSPFLMKNKRRKSFLNTIGGGKGK
jgi:hypothetical protein